jgi:hypothetical protein
MKVYTYSQARQNLATLLEQAAEDGQVLIKRQDGQVFAVRPEVRRESPLDVPGVDLELTANEIVGFVQEGRRALEWAGPAGQERTYAYAVNEAREVAYGETAQDKERETEEFEWSEATIGDVGATQEDEAPCSGQKHSG